MLGKETIKRNLTRIDVSASSCNELFEKMNQVFLDGGYVNEKYLPTIEERESKYPTALPVEPDPIAIPHTEADAIITPFIAPVRLATTIPWGDMSDPTNTLQVKLVFMLGFNEPGAHIELLQILMHNFSRPDWVNTLYSAKTEDEFYQAVMDMDWSHD
ncbi:MAG: PTS sugar transporter subunit IIA [Coriobacteriales bacterium]|nr:PTS sugar transporter subunit IIA [Coriobacteriales bacterium]